MTDDLLDEATRLAGDYADHHHDYGMARVLNELVERVQQAERRANFEAMRAVSESIERDAARGKLDKVRDWAHHIRTTRQRGDIEYNAASEVLAILDD